MRKRDVDNEYGLTRHEIRALALASEGRTNNEITRLLGYNAKHLLTEAGIRLGTGNRTKMVAIAIRAKLIP